MESESARVKELESSLIAAQLSLNECELKLNAIQMELSECEVKLQTEQEKSKSSAIKLDAEMNKWSQSKQLLENKLKERESELHELNERAESQKQSWSQEKHSLVAKKDEELQKVIFQLEKRFEEDYSKFMQTHKDAMHRTLNEKSQEHAKEKESLIELYQAKFNEYEVREQSLQKQIKELRERVSANALIVPPPKPKVGTPVDAKTQTDSPDAEYVDSLLNKIGMCFIDITIMLFGE